jgi:hypothetical protein
MGRPPIDFGAKLRELLQHVDALSAEAARPLAHYNRSATDAWNLRDYVQRKLTGGVHYKSVVERHMAALDRMLLVNLIEGFERFLKEIAAVCVDHVSEYVLDDRFDEFPVKGSLLAAHFGADSLGKSLCESAQWLDCESINKRFRRLLADPFDEQKGKFYLFPRKGQEPAPEQSRYEIVSLLWQLRHTIVHNVGIITQSDAVKLRVLVRGPVDAPRLLKPTRDDVRYVKRFLDETAESVNQRVAHRLAELLSHLHAEDPTLFDPQEKADGLAAEFGVTITVAGASGTQAP